MSEATPFRGPDAELTKIVRTGDPLDPWQRALAGKTVQLRIPILDPVDLRRSATILRELAARMDALSRDTKNTAFNVLMNARSETKAAQGRLMSRPRSRAL